MTYRWCTNHNDKESADGIGYCWMAAVPYTDPDPCEFIFVEVRMSIDQDDAERKWNERIATGLFNLVQP